MMKIKYLYNSTGSTDNQKVLLFFCSMSLSCINLIQFKTELDICFLYKIIDINTITYTYVWDIYDIYCFYCVKFLPHGVVVHPFDVGSSIDSWW